MVRAVVQKVPARLGLVGLGKSRSGTVGLGPAGHGEARAVTNSEGRRDGDVHPPGKVGRREHFRAIYVVQVCPQR